MLEKIFNKLGYVRTSYADNLQQQLTSLKEDYDEIFNQLVDTKKELNQTIDAHNDCYHQLGKEQRSNKKLIRKEKVLLRKQGEFKEQIKELKDKLQKSEKNFNKLKKWFDDLGLFIDKYKGSPEISVLNNIPKIPFIMRMKVNDQH